MKKIFSVLMICCFSLIAGTLLTACGEQDFYNVSVSKSGDTANLLSVSLYDGQNKIEPDANDNYHVGRGKSIRVVLDATDFGVEMTELKVLVDGTEKKVVVNDNYSPLVNGTSLNYGYFILPNVTANVNIEFSGVKTVESTFDFKVAGFDDVSTIEDEELIEKLQMTSICLSYGEITDEEGEQPAPVYENLYDYLQKEDTSFSRPFSYTEDVYNPYTTFRVKFDAGAPFDLTNAFPFKILPEGGQEQDIASMMFMDDEDNGFYLVDMGDIGKSNHYTILIDFTDVDFQSFNIALPRANLTFSASVDNSIIDYSTSSVLTITEFLTDTNEDFYADYSNMVVYLNNKELDQIEGSESTDDAGNPTVQYQIPEHITPISTGGFSLYEVKISGVEYNVNQYSLYANSVEPIANQQVLIPNIYAVDDDGTALGITGTGANGQVLGLDGQRNAIVWEFPYDSSLQAYVNPYDLYNYDIFLNVEEEPTDDNKILNVGEQLAGETADVVKEIGDYTFRAFYNEETEKFDLFQLDFTCTGDMIFEFRNFQMFSKNINISYAFDDSRIEKVEFAILERDGNIENASWKQLSKDVPITNAVIGGEVVAFRFTTSDREHIATIEFKIENSTMCSSWMDGIFQSAGDNKNYSICRYVVSYIQYDGDMDFKLISSLQNPSTELLGEVA